MENFVDFIKRKGSEIYDWLTDPKTRQALSNTMAIIDRSEFPSKNEEERYQNAINETDSTVLERQKQIGNTLPIMMSSMIPGSQYVWGGIGAYGIKKSIDDYRKAETDNDKNDAIFNGVLSASICLPISKEAEAIIAKRSTELLKSMKNWPKPKLKYKNHYSTAKSVEEVMDKYNLKSMTPSKTVIYGEQTVPDGKMKGVIEAAQKEAANFVGNDMVQTAKRFNEDVIKRINIDNRYRNNLAELEQRPLVDIIFISEPKIDGHIIDGAFGNIGGHFTNKQGNAVTIYNSKLQPDRLYSSAYHESLHSLGLGMPITEEGYDFMNLKADKVLIPREKVAPWKWEDYDYLRSLNDNGNELYVNMAEIGRALGIKPGQPRPATQQEMYAILENAKNVIPGKAGYIDFLDKNKWYKTWNLFNGTYKDGGKFK